MRPLTKKIIELRLSGKSYKEICNTVNCCKSHVSYACNKYIENNKDLVKKRMCSREHTTKQMEAMYRGHVHYFATKKNNDMNIWIKNLSEHTDQCFIYYILGLFDGDGTHHGNDISLINSNPTLIYNWIYFVNNVLKAQSKNTLQIRSTHDKKECVAHWNSFNISFDYIRCYDTGGQKRNYSAKENYGTARIRVIKPNGLREALEKYRYDMFSKNNKMGGTGIEPATTRM